MPFVVYPPQIDEVPISLEQGGTGADLVDPGADRILFWDDSAGTLTWLTLGTNLSITGTTINAASGGSTGTGIVLLSSTTVSCNVGTKQALYTVPASRLAVATSIVLHSPSTSLAAMTDSLTFGFDAGASNWPPSAIAAILAELNGVTKGINLVASNSPDEVVGFVLGSAASVFGCIFNDASITATLIIDVFGYTTLANGTPVANISVP